jgi:xanthosine utilization system XapX-like protein
VEKFKREANSRRVAMGAFANSVKTAGKFEWIMTVIAFTLFGGFFVAFVIRYLNFPLWTLFAALFLIFILGLYIGYEIYLSRVIRGNEIKSLLELSSLVGHVVDKLDKVEMSLMKELDLVIGIKKDVVKNEQDKVEASKLSVEKIQKDIDEKSEENMIFKWCPNDKEEVFVSRQMNLCPFCWSTLQNLEPKINGADKKDVKSSQTAIETIEAEEIMFD